MRFLLAIPVATLSLAGLAASERQLSYTHDSNVLAPGQKEIEVWGTFRSGRDYYYRRVDNRIELEYGVAEHLQTAVYLNFSSVNSDPSGTGTVETDQVNGISWEWKWKLADAVADPVGAALYLEGTASGHELEAELKGIIDKRFGDELIALNLTVEPEWENERKKHPEVKLEASLGWSHVIAKGFAIGLELRNTHLIERETSASGNEEWKHLTNVFHGGPSIHLAQNGFWATITAMPQLFAVQSASGNEKKNRERQEAEDLEVRALIGFSF